MRLQDVFKTSSRRLQDVLQKGLQNVLKTSSKHLQDVLKNVFKTSSRRLQDVSSLFLLTRLREALNTFLRRSFPKTITDEYAQVTPLLINLWSVNKICKRDKNFPSFGFSIYYTFSGCI